MQEKRENITLPPGLEMKSHSGKYLNEALSGRKTVALRIQFERSTHPSALWAVKQRTGRPVRKSPLLHGRRPEPLGRQAKQPSQNQQNKEFVKSAFSFCLLQLVSEVMRWLAPSRGQILKCVRVQCLRVSWFIGRQGRCSWPGWPVARDDRQP